MQLDGDARARRRSSATSRGPLGLDARRGGGGGASRRDRADGRARSRRSRSTRASTRAARCSSAAAARPASTRSRSRAGSAVRASDRPDVGAALSAAGALLSELTADFAATADHDDRRLRPRRRVARSLAGLRAALRARSPPRPASAPGEIELSAEARYPHQVWELEVPLRDDRSDAAELEAPRTSTRSHEEIFAIRDPSRRSRSSPGARACAAPSARRAGARSRRDVRRARRGAPRAGPTSRRSARVETPVRLVRASSSRAASSHGPAIVESPVTTVVVDPGATVERTAERQLALVPVAGARAPSAAETATAYDGRRPARGAQQPLRGHRPRDDEHARCAPAARASSTRPATSPAASSPRDDELLAMAESLPIHVMSGPDLIAALHEGDASRPRRGRRVPAQLAVPRQLPRRRLVRRRAGHRRRRACTASPCSRRRTRPTAATRCRRPTRRRARRLQGGRADLPVRAGAARLRRRRRRHPDVPAADPRARAVVGRLPRAARRGADRRAAAARARRRGRLATRSSEYAARVVRLQRAADGRGDPAPAGRAASSREGRARPVPGRAGRRPGAASTVAVDPEAAPIEVDLRDNLDCQPCGLNLTEATARTAAMIGVFNRLDHTRAPERRQLPPPRASTCARTAASLQRCRSSVQHWGRYSSRSIRACPCRLRYAMKTPI